MDGLFDIIGYKLDIFAIAETKIDDSFPEHQFKVSGYNKPYLLDKSSNSGGILIYVRNGIFSNIIAKLDTIQLVAIELRLGKEKWAFVCIYRPPSQNLSYFLEKLTEVIDNIYTNYANVLIVGDFNIEPIGITEFLENHQMVNLINVKTCFKSPVGTSIDLALTNSKSKLFNCSAVETGMSDHHLMIYGFFKVKFSKIPPVQISYRNYKSFSFETFNSQLSTTLCAENFIDYDIFQNIFVNLLDIFAPLKKKTIRGNNKPHVNSILRKEIMKRSRLKKIANRSGNSLDITAYKKQRNLVVKLNREQKTHFFNNIDTKNPNQSLWNLCKPYIGKSMVTDTFQILHEDTVVSDEIKIANLFNTYYCNINNTLNISYWEPNSSRYISYLDPVERCIVKYDSHPSIVKIRKYFTPNRFVFMKVSVDDVTKYALNLNKKKKTSGCIPTKILQGSIQVIAPYVTQMINNMIDTSTFPNSLKLAEIKPAHKKGSTTDMGNFRPISLLPIVSKLFERILYDQLNAHFEGLFSPLLCGFRKGHSSQHALLKLLLTWHKILDYKGVVGAVLMDLSKAFDTLPHDLIIAKLACYGVSKKSLDLIHNFLSSRKQRVKIGSNFSQWLQIILGVPQGSILGPLLFNIFINDLFMFILETSICNFADDNTLYSCDFSYHVVKYTLKADIGRSLEWFEFNSLVANPDKFQLIFLGSHQSGNDHFEIAGINVPPSKSVKLLGVEIDKHLNFNSHITKLCKTANNKTNALIRIRNFLDEKQALKIAQAYILSQFNYCNLIWMFCSKTSNNKIVQTHKRALRAIHQDNSVSYQDLLTVEHSIDIHQRNLQTLMCEVFKSLNHLNPSFLWNIFIPKEIPYSLRNGSLLTLPPVKGKLYGVYCLKFRSSYSWNNLPKDIKSASSLIEFKRLLKHFLFNEHKKIICNCRLCRD